MKTILLFLFTTLSLSAWAQFDDIYFDPDADEYYVSSYTEKEGGDTYVTENYYYDDDEYDYYDREYADQDYYYSSRIRRFNRPFYYSGGFYDPFFYDPFYYGSGLNISFGSGFGRFGRYNAFNRFGYNGFYDPFGYDPFFYGSGFGRASYLSCYFGYASPFYYPGYYGYGGYGGYGGYNNFYNTNNYYGSVYDRYQPVLSNRGSYYGSRQNKVSKAYTPRVSSYKRIPSTRHQTNRVSPHRSSYTPSKRIYRDRTSRIAPSKTYSNPSRGKSEVYRGSRSKSSVGRSSTPSRTYSNPSKSVSRPSTPSRQYSSPSRTPSSVGRSSTPSRTSSNSASPRRRN